MSYAHPYERPVAVGGFEVIHGPEALADTIVQQYRKRWVAWVATDGIRFAQYTDGFTFSDTAGTANTLFTAGERPSRFSWSFEQDALYAIAYEDGVNSILMRRFVAGVPTDYTWSGKSPILFYNGILEPTTGDTDLVALYIKDDGDKIFIRVQRENFGTEHELNGSLNVILEKLIKTEAVNIDGSWHQMIWARTTAGRDVVYQSRAYPPPIIRATDTITLAVGLQSGVYFSPITNGASADAMALSVSLSGGEAFNSVVTRFSPGDRISMSLNLQSGTYSLVVIGTSAPVDKLSLAPALQSGLYSEVTVYSGTQTDKISLSVGLQSGVYSL